VGDKFSTQLTATGGSGTGFTFTGVNLPAGLTLSSAGLLSGAPTTAAGSPFLFTVTVTDSKGGTVSHTYSLAVDPALVINPTTLPVAKVGNSFSTQLTATGGSGAGYAFTDVNLPAWLTLSSTGLLSGTPTTASGSPFVFTVTATDSNGGTVSHTYSLVVSP
jgi:protocatechuate 3,4-dioxygenase beta subunit